MIHTTITQYWLIWRHIPLYGTWRMFSTSWLQPASHNFHSKTSEASIAQSNMHSTLSQCRTNIRLIVWCKQMLILCWDLHPFGWIMIWCQLWNWACPTKKLKKTYWDFFRVDLYCDIHKHVTAIKNSTIWSCVPINKYQ